MRNTCLSARSYQNNPKNLRIFLIDHFANLRLLNYDGIDSGKREGRKEAREQGHAIRLRLGQSPATERRPRSSRAARDPSQEWKSYGPRKTRPSDARLAEFSEEKQGTKAANNAVRVSDLFQLQQELDSGQTQKIGGQEKRLWV